jgi:hypothetical protein
MPVDVKPVSVPTEVIFGCAAVVSVAAIPESVTVSAVDVALSSMPVEVNVVNVPAAADDPPITVPSIVPALMSMVLGEVPISMTVPPESSV